MKSGGRDEVGEVRKKKGGGGRPKTPGFHCAHPHVRERERNGGGSSEGSAKTPNKKRRP